MTQFSARYYDGETSRGHDVQVRVDTDNVLSVDGLDTPLSLALAELRIAPRLGNTARALTFPSGAKLETLENDVVDELAARLGRSRGLRFVHLLESSWKMALGALVLLGLLVAAGYVWGVPILARKVAERIPTDMARQLGSGTLASLDKFLFKPSELDPAVQGRLQRAFTPLVQSDRDWSPTLVFRKARFPNAFALPDGTVVVTDELVNLAKQDEQILAVLAHELGHLHHRHSLRMALESSAVALVVGTYLGDATQFAAVTATLPAVVAQAHYSREHETEADTFALERMREHGIAPHHFADVLNAMEQEMAPDAKEDGKKEGRAERALQYLSSHPRTAERAARFQ